MGCMTGWIENWLERHQHPVSRVLHGVGVPILIGALVLGAWQLVAWRWDLWWRPVGLIVASYALQWVGHVMEGNDMGEVIVVKKLMGRPFVAVSPRYGGREETVKR